MKIESSQILDQLSPVIKQSVGKSFDKWCEFHRGRMSELESILNSLKILLVHTDEWAEKPVGLWDEIEIQMAKVKLWTQSIKYISSDDFDKKIAEPLTSDLNQFLSLYQEEIHIQIDKSYWQTQREDGIIRQLRKKWQPLKHSISETYVNLMNQYRLLRHRPPLKSRTDERILNLYKLVDYYIKIPVQKFQIDEWQRYLQVIIGQLFVLQLNLKDFTTKSLIIEKLPVILDPEKKNDIFDNLFELAEVLKNVDETLQALNKYEEQFYNRFEQTWEEISKNFAKMWHWAGTFQLKYKKYSGAKLSNLAYALTSRFKKYSIAWIRHFEALQGEWQKNADISLLRYKTISNLYETSRQLHQGIHQEIQPNFTHTMELLKKTFIEIEAINNNEDLSKLIISRRKSILNVLQVLLETIHGVNIVRILERSLYAIESAVSAIGPQYLIYKYQDTERRPPHSTMENIPLKDLIENALYVPYKEKSKTLILKNESEIEHILRVISEIDQLIEFNCNSTLKLINQSGDLPVFKRAKNEMEEGIERALILLTDLMETLIHIQAQSTHVLLENSLEFEKQLDKLIDSERLFKFKSHLQRKRSRSNLYQKLSGIYGFTKSLLPSLFRKSLNWMKQLWIKYFSLSSKESEQTEPAMEKIRNYLTETENRIERLPFIYQKLFHLQALNDNQFFTNRINEIRLLKSEYELWQNGQPTSIAIIGERGSGLTTFMNYAENQIFKDISVIRIIFRKPENSEKNILRMVNMAFNLPAQTSWSSLEEKVNEEKTIRICLVENLQFMYLKTVSGFEGIEKFLQFLSKTKHKIFWLATCTLYSWQFLEKAIGLNSYFHRLLKLHKISPEELKSIILRRHRASGYHLEFESSSKPFLKKKGRTKDSNPQQAILEDTFFKKLHNIAGGNITTAILIWLRSIKEFSQEKIVLTALFEFDFSILDQLPHEKLLTLGAVLHHEKLSPESHAVIFNHNFEKSRLMLENLETDGLLMRNGDGFQIHPFIYRPLVHSLDKKHIVS
jgi:hypothetical protein